MSTINSAFNRPSLVEPALTSDLFSTDAEVFPFVLKFEAVKIAGVEKTIKSFNVDFPDGEERYTFKVKEGENTTYYPASGNTPAYQIIKGSVPVPSMRGAHRIAFSGQDAVNRPGGKFEGQTPEVILTSPSLLLTMVASDPVDGYRAVPPSGVKIHRQRDICRVEWDTPEDEDLMGVRVLVSPDASGVRVPYRQYGELIKTVTRVVEETLETSTQVKMDEDSKTTTILEIRKKVNVSSIDIPSSAFDSDVFYVALSTVILDKTTNHVYESEQVGPLQCGFVDLRKVTPSDFLASQQQTDIAARMISNITELYPELDLSPRSEMRDLLIDPVAIELSNSSVREWFARVSSSISALAHIDDEDEDGISDPVSGSTTKQILQRAFGLDDAALQKLIDRQFDVLGEQAGIARGGAETAIVDVTLFTTLQPTSKTVFRIGSKVATVPDETTPALTFTLRGSAILDPSNLSAYYNPQQNRWEVTLPAQCDTAGAIGNAAGAGSIRKLVSGISTPWQVVNSSSADFGVDVESNIRFASRIQDRMIVGVDTGTRKGLLGIARSTPGIVDAKVIASGDPEMLRDWIPVPGKHIYGCVDIYARGRSFSQSDENRFYAYGNVGAQGYPGTYAKMKIHSPQNLQLTLEVDEASRIVGDIIGVGELFVDMGSGRTFYFGVEKATVFKALNGSWIITLDRDEFSYVTRTTPIADQKPITRVGANGNKIPNSVAFGSLSPTITAVGFLRLASEVSLIPKRQPVTRVYAVTGESGTYKNGNDIDSPMVALTGLLPAATYRLIQSSSPLLEGYSVRAGDKVQVDNSLEVVTKTLQFKQGGASTLVIDEGMFVSHASDGKPQALLSVVGEPQSTNSQGIVGLIPYTFGKDYVITKTGRYGVYSISRPEGSTIPLNADFLVSYNRYRLRERIIPAIDTEITLNGTQAVPLPHAGIIRNAWIPHSHGHSLLTEGSDIYFEPNPGQTPVVPWKDRYLRVLVMRDGKKTLALEGRDYNLVWDADTSSATIARTSITSSGTGGATSSALSLINDGETVYVSYYRYETFSFTTQYPSYLSSVASRIEEIRHAGADVLVKSMLGNRVDISMTVELDPSSSPEIVDPKIRTVIGMVLDQASGQLSQAEIIRQVKGIRGVQSVRLPLNRFAKSDGSYEVGSMIPVGTQWESAKDVLGIHDLTSHVFISAKPVLKFPTLASGGLPDASVTMTYEGETLKRALTFSDMLVYKTPMFYIIGSRDSFMDGKGNIISIGSQHARKVVIIPKATITNPSLYPFRVTYQIFGEGGAQDLSLSPTEYVIPGRILIEYVSGKGR